MSQANKGNDSVTIHTATYYLYIRPTYSLIIFISCIFHVLYNTQSRITRIWSWNYMHFQFNIYYNSILCLYILISRGYVYTMVVDLFSPPDTFYRYLRSGGSIYWSLRTALGGNKSHVTPARTINSTMVITIIAVSSSKKLLSTTVIIIIIIVVVVVVVISII